MKNKFDNDWYVSNSKINGKNKLLNKSAEVLAASLARKTTNPRAKNDDNCILSRENLVAYYNASNPLKKVFSDGVLKVIGFYSKGGSYYASESAEQLVEYTLDYYKDPITKNPLIRASSPEKYLDINSGLNDITSITMSNDFTICWVIRLLSASSSYSAKRLCEDGVGNTYIKINDLNTIELCVNNVTGAFDHIGVPLGDFAVFSLRRSNSNVELRVNGVECVSGTGLATVYGDPFTANVFLNDLHVDFSSIAMFSEYIDMDELIAIEDYLIGKEKHVNNKWTGLKYHAIGAGNASWSAATYASGISVVSSGLTTEVARAIPYYCAFVENYISTAEGGSNNFLSDNNLKRYSPASLLGKTLYIGSGTNAGQAGIITYDPELDIIDNYTDYRVYISPSMSSGIDSTSVYEIRNVPVQGEKITDKVILKTTFLNNSGSNYVIREHGLFGGNASENLNSGLIFNHAILSGTNAQSFNDGTTLELEFLMKLV